MVSEYDLTLDERHRFVNLLKELGMSESQIIPRLDTGLAPGTTILSDTPVIGSVIKPVKFVFKSLEDASQLVNVGHTTKLFSSLPAWPPENNNIPLQDLEPEEVKHIPQAFSAFLCGFLDQVTSYGQVLEKHYFPLSIGAFAVENVTVSAGHPLILSGDHLVCNFGILTIEKGGEIQIRASDIIMNCQKIISKSVADE